MKFTPRNFKENVNISQTSPIRELFALLGGILGGLLLLYFILGFALDIFVERMPAALDKKLGNLFAAKFNIGHQRSELEQKIQKLLEELCGYLPRQDMSFTVHVVKSEQVNALALPGGHILVFSKLIGEVESENELAMVLAHELGHFRHRDHLRALGRSLVLTAITSFLFGADSGIANFSQKMLLTAEFKFSRKQEVAADLFALELVNKRYGHVAGAGDFFERLKDKEKLPAFAKFLSTHPYPVERVKILNREIEKKGYRLSDKVPFDFD